MSQIATTPAFWIRRAAARSLVMMVSLAPVAACGPSPYSSPPSIWGYPGSATPGPVGGIIDTIATQTPEANNVPAYDEVLDAPYDRVFAQAVRVLNERGDDVIEADSDKAYIVTRGSMHMTVMLTPYYLRFFVAFEEISKSRTRIVFKVVAWEHIYETHSVIPVSADYFVGWKARQFVEAVQTAVR